MAQLKRRYEVGLEKLLTAEREVNVMKQELIELQPKLIETGVCDRVKVLDDLVRLAVRLCPGRPRAVGYRHRTLGSDRCREGGG